MKYFLLLLISLECFAMSDTQLKDCINMASGNPLSIGTCDIAEFSTTRKEVLKGQAIVIAMRIKNKGKNLTVNQKKQFLNKTKDIVPALLAGSLDTAKDLAEALPVDADILQSDKELITGVIP